MSELKHTALLDWHKTHGAKIVPFAGYAMPVQYPNGVMKEHAHTRKKASLFDVSHMGQVVIKDANAAQVLETIFPANLIDLPENHQVYSLLLTEQGGVLDDLMICRRADDWLLVLNASRKEVDLDYLERRLEGHLSLTPLDDQSLLALQGPEAINVLERAGAKCSHLHFMQGDWLSIDGIDCWVTRSGYTGEDGFEISVSNSQVEALAEMLLADDAVELAGLGARDTLRLEAGLCLYGHELTEKTSPTDASLNWAIAKVRRKGEAREGGFLGAPFVLDQMQSGTDVVRLGFVAEGRAPVRAETVLYDHDGHEVGKVTSGTFSPTLQKPIVMAQVHKQCSDMDSLIAKVRNKEIVMNKVKLPFVPANYYRG